jgi:hypothetical protein
MPGPNYKHKPGVRTQAAADAPVLHQPLARLVAIGLRLSELRSADALPGLLIDGAAELSSARRALLVLEAPGGSRLVGSRVPPGEDALALLSAVTPWLEEARRTRKARLRHGPQGAGAVDLLPGRPVDRKARTAGLPLLRRRGRVRPIR